MRWQHSSKKRRGAIIPLVAICLVAILGMVALAIDIGMVAVGKTQAQNAADTAAMTGARTFNQQSGYNLANVPGKAVTAAVANKIYNTAVNGDPGSITNPSADVYVSGDVRLEFGGYYYVYNDADSSKEEFKMMFPSNGGKAATEPYTAVRATITTSSAVFFGKVFGASPFNVKATAVAAHRPRDVIIIMDLSGSMRFQSCSGCYVDSNGEYHPNYGPRTVSLNPESFFPEFGHYSDKTAAALQGTLNGSTGDEFVGLSNVSADYAPAGDSIIADFMSSGSVKAFTRSSNAYNTAPGGQDFLKTGTTYVKTITEYLGTATPKVDIRLEYERATGTNKPGYGSTFKNYTEGPGYWGKTFFVWPPDPRGSDLDANTAANHADNGAKDWRQRFFFKQKSDGTLGWLDHNTILFSPTGAPDTTDGGTANPILRDPDTFVDVTENGATVSYRLCINYAAIFQWLRNETPTHFPSAMTTGRIKYYESIPNPSGDSNFNNRFWTQSPMTNLSERFWKDYVDFMLGYRETGANTYSNTHSGDSVTAYIGNGDLFKWGSTAIQITQRPDNDYKATTTAAYAAGYTGSISLTNVQTLGGSTLDLPGPQPITAVTIANPAVFTSAGHGLSNDQTINVTGIGNAALGLLVNNSSTKPKPWIVKDVTTNTFTLQNPDTGTKISSSGTSYTANTGWWVPAITNATNANPIVITTSAKHKIPSGKSFTVSVFNVAGNTGANGKWIVTRVDDFKYSMENAAGTGTYSNNTTGLQWWEPHYYLRFGNGSSFYELDPVTTISGALAGSAVKTDGITADPLAVAVASGAAVKIYTTVPKFMDYADNTYRPRHQYWFGAMSFTDWLGNYSVWHDGKNYTLRWPGNVHEAQAWSAKIGISAAIDDIKNNHPNDFIGLTFFSSPSYDTGGGGQHNAAVIPLGRNYQGMKDSLWFPPTTVSGGVTSITPYDADFNNVPRSKGGTSPGMGLMIAYNLLNSSTSNLRTYTAPSTTYRGYAGGLGRRCASRLVILETDGAPNTTATRSLSGSGANSYYPIRQKSATNIADGANESPSSSGNVTTDVYNVAKQICALDTASPPGYSTARKKAKVYTIGYGSIFDPANANSAQTDALNALQGIQTEGNTGTLQSWQRIYGDNTTRQTKMRDAFTRIMQDGVQVSLLE